MKRGAVRTGVVMALLLLLLLGASAYAIDPLPFKDRTEELRFQALTKQLRCPLCQNESLADSQAGVAKDLRQKVFEMMQAGRSDDEIKQFLTARYSDFVLYDPPLKGSTALLWFMPLLTLLGGAAAVALVVRRRARSGIEARSAAVAATAVAAPAVEDDW